MVNINVLFILNWFYWYNYIKLFDSGNWYGDGTIDWQSNLFVILTIDGDGTIDWQSNLFVILTIDMEMEQLNNQT